MESPSPGGITGYPLRSTWLARIGAPQVHRLWLKQHIVRVTGREGGHSDPAERRGCGKGRAKTVRKHFGVEHRPFAGLLIHHRLASSFHPMMIASRVSVTKSNDRIEPLLQ